MKTDIKSSGDFYKAICEDKLVFIFGTGISAALTGKTYSWYKWISDGISALKDAARATQLQTGLDASSSADNLIAVAGKVLSAAKAEGAYSDWMHESFEAADITNHDLANTLQKLTVCNDVLATTNYDLLLERATGLSTLSYEQPDQAFEMLNAGQSNAVLHLHGVYDSTHGIDTIVADKEQYKFVLNDKGAQFIQNLLGTRTLVFVGCGKTTEDLNIRQFVEFARTYLKMDRPYYFLYNTSSPIEGLPDNIQLIAYGDNYSDLPGFLEELAVARIQHKISASRIIGRTAFDANHATGDTVLKYHYARRSVPFCGREKELERLQEFIGAEEAFSWWSITGQAGSGKSRLAYEFIRQLPTAWFGFFIHDRIFQSDVEAFTPFCNTTVVIDYVAGRERQVAEVVIGLRQVFASTKYKLRILLLERANNRLLNSWYSNLLKCCGKIEADTLKTTEYSDSFLDLGELEKAAVIALISDVCNQHGLNDNPAMAEELYGIYAQKLERLKFRPLYVQLFVEAWIRNGCDLAKYDRFTELLEDLLQREQEKWLSSVNGDQAVCNACVRLLIRANIAPLRTDNIPGLYKKDWEIVHKYIASTAFIGRQKEEFQDTLINSLCQNIDSSHEVIAPQFPDIIKEYMFSYYTDADELPEIMKEIWQNAAAAFNRFISRCMMDFPEQSFFKQAIQAYEASTQEADVLAGRLAFLENRFIQKGEDPQVFWDLIDNEHRFWGSVAVPEKDGEKDQIAILKVAGLHKVAEHIGAWSLYDVSEMIDVIEEMLAVQGGEGTEAIKKFLLSESVKALSVSSFRNESKYLQEKLDQLIAGSEESERDSFFQMHNDNARMMDLLLSDDVYAATEVFREMGAKWDKVSAESACILAHSCFTIDHFCYFLGRADSIGLGYSVACKLEKRFPNEAKIKARRIGCQCMVLQGQFFDRRINNDELGIGIETLAAELRELPFTGDEADEALGVAWGALNTLKLNIASQKELEEMIQETGAILQVNPYLSDVATTRVCATQALHRTYLHTKITHGEVEKLYQHVLKIPNSETLRGAFFSMLNESEDKGKTRQYLNADIIREALQDAKYNPVFGSGIPEIDFQQAMLDDLLAIRQPYVRECRKVGRNEPCPCGSGKKFKKCCLGKGVFD